VALRLLADEARLGSARSTRGAAVPFPLRWPRLAEIERQFDVVLAVDHADFVKGARGLPVRPHADPKPAGSEASDGAWAAAIAPLVRRLVHASGEGPNADACAALVDEDPDEDAASLLESHGPEVRVSPS